MVSEPPLEPFPPDLDMCALVCGQPGKIAGCFGEPAPHGADPPINPAKGVANIVCDSSHGVTDLEHARDVFAALKGWGAGHGLGIAPTVARCQTGVELQDITGYICRMRPPWLSFLTEPIYAALEQAEARVRDLEGELLRLDPEHFRRLKEGTNQPAEVSAENRSSSHETHPADAAWLASEQARIAGLTERELADLMSTLEAKLGAEALDLLLAGASLSEAGIDADADLERLVERLRGFTGGEDAR